MHRKLNFANKDDTVKHSGQAMVSSFSVCIERGCVGDGTSEAKVRFKIYADFSSDLYHKLKISAVLCSVIFHIKTICKALDIDKFP